MKENGNVTPRQTESDGQQKLPVALEAFDIVRETLIAEAGNTEEVRQALLACDEWIANVVNYSGADDFSFICRSNGETLCISFSDNGIPFDPTQSTGTTAEFEYLDLGGMGINLIRQSAKKMAYKREGNYNILTLYFECNAVRKQKKEDTVT